MGSKKIGSRSGEKVVLRFPKVPDQVYEANYLRSTCHVAAQMVEMLVLLIQKRLQLSGNTLQW